jgi:hypothetical protein
MSVKITIIFPNMEKKFNSWRGKWSTNGHFSSKKAKLFSTHGEKKCHNGEKMGQWRKLGHFFQDQRITCK